MFHSSITTFLFVLLACAGSPVLSTPAPVQERSLSGTATYFYVGLGACGDTNVDSDLIVALATNTFASGANCDKSILITDPSSGKTATATVKDMCPSCADGDLDMSESLFTTFRGSTDEGVFDVTWDFV